MVALIPQHAERIKPPRTLAVPYQLGRPLGVPDDAQFQHKVLSAALSMLLKTEGPIIEYYNEPAPIREESLEGWACPINFASSLSDGDNNNSIGERVNKEVSLLQPWYDKGRKDRGYSSVGLSGVSVSDAVTFLAGFLESSNNEKSTGVSPIRGFSVADSIKHCAEDLKSFYNEAATSQPGEATAQEIENWYWGESEAGKMIREIRKSGMVSDDKMVKIVASFVLVPHSQIYRDT